LKCKAEFRSKPPPQTTANLHRPRPNADYHRPPQRTKIQLTVQWGSNLNTNGEEILGFGAHVVARVVLG